MTNLAPGEILGAPVYKGRDVRLQYALTPAFDPATIPAGRAAHVGGGVWRKVCASPGCGAYVETWGMPWLVVQPIASHERAHGLDVIGVNVAVLP